MYWTKKKKYCIVQSILCEAQLCYDAHANVLLTRKTMWKQRSRWMSASSTLKAETWICLTDMDNISLSGCMCQQARQKHCSDFATLWEVSCITKLVKFFLWCLLYLQMFLPGTCSFVFWAEIQMKSQTFTVWWIKERWLRVGDVLSASSDLFVWRKCLDSALKKHSDLAFFINFQWLHLFSRYQQCLKHLYPHCKSDTIKKFKRTTLICSAVLTSPFRTCKFE